MPKPSKKPETGWSAFRGEQKVGLIVFSVTGVLGMILSLVFLRSQITAPFEIDPNTPEYLSLTEREVQEVARQKTEDTDGDGISDYEELNVYRTSPYLPDSDSDGFDDGAEINSGNDPNCPVGQDCGRGVDAGINNPVRVGDITGDLPFEDTGIGVGEINNEADLNEILGALTNQDIRDSLIASGVDEAALNDLTDEELRALFNEALQQLSESEENSGT